MKIVVLDGYAANPGDLLWDDLCALGETEIYDRTHKNDIIARAKDAEIILTNKCPISKETIDQLPNLRYIGVLATGYNIVDTEYAAKAGIVVTNIPAYSTKSVAQHVFALMLEIAVHAGEHSASALNGQWQNSKDFCYWNHPLTELSGKTLGIIGHGAIGREVEKIALAFDMNVKAYSPSRCTKDVLDDIIQHSDVISLNCPLTSLSAGMISKSAIDRMKKGVWIINTARGGLVNEQDAADALRSGQIGAFAADVVSIEPIRPDNPLLSAPNVILTPHIAWATAEARARLMKIAVENVKCFLEGNIQNAVNV